MLDMGDKIYEIEHESAGSARTTLAPNSRSLSLETNCARNTATLMAISTSVPRLLAPPNALAPAEVASGALHTAVRALVLTLFVLSRLHRSLTWDSFAMAHAMSRLSQILSAALRAS